MFSEVAEYDQSRLQSHTKYTYTVPELYDNLINIITRWPGCHSGSTSGESTTEEGKEQLETELMKRIVLSFKKYDFPFTLKT
jgi:hypothetical protein